MKPFEKLPCPRHGILHLFAMLLLGLTFILGFASCQPEIEYREKIVEKPVDKVYAKAVTFTSAAGENNGSITVSMKSETEGAVIYYTTDGTVPTTQSTKYTQSLSLTENKVIMAIAVKEGIENSPVSVASVSIVEKTITTTVTVTTSSGEPETITVTQYVDQKADEVAPSNVTNLAASARDGRILLTWTDATDSDVYGYEVTYSGTSAINRVVLPALNSKSMMAPQGAGGCYVGGLTNGTTYTFTIKTVDTSGNKSAGVTASATPFAPPAGAALQIALSVPAARSNTSVTVTANITSASSIKKVVYKKNGSVVAKTLLADTSAIVANEDTDDNSKWTFTISATDETVNGIYTIAAIDNDGREETEQITINNFDFTPPVSVSGLTAIWSGNHVTLSWTNPSTVDFDHIEITYTYKDDSSESTQSQPISASGTEKSIIVKEGSESNAKIYTYYVKSVDQLGNKSTAIKRRVAVVEGVKAGYVFHDTVESLPAGTDGTLGTSGTYVYFGDWPQTIKASSVTVDETVNMTMGDFTYYKGSDDNWYAKCIEDAFASYYTYSDGTSTSLASSNSEKYFKVEPIKWRVLNPTASGSEKKILLADIVLTGNVPYYGSNTNRTLYGTTIYPNNYKYSNIRAYLNGIKNQFEEEGGGWSYAYTNPYTIDWTGKGFLYSAFTSTAITQIDDTEIDNSARSTNPAGEENANLWNSGENQFACENTTDKIFLLSEQQVTDSSLGFTPYDSGGWGNSRMHFATDYAKANKVDLGMISNSVWGGKWWLRSPDYSGSGDAVHCVKYSSDANLCCFGTSSSVGVVPALYLK